MTPKQYIKYVRWIEKNNLAICDGSTMEPITFLELLKNVIIIFGVMGIGILFIHTFKKWLKK